MQEHALLGGTLKINNPLGVEGQRKGVVAMCTCGWEETHFSSLAASAAFRGHQEDCRRADAPSAGRE
jgi:hypothetical protein